MNLNNNNQHIVIQFNTSLDVLILIDLLSRYNEDLEGVGNQEARSLCRRADIVGVTSTGAAKYFDIIHKIQPR